MTTFDKREEGFEKKFALDEEQKFKAEARRNRLLGLWAADKLGLSRRCRHGLFARKWSRLISRKPATQDVQNKVVKDFAAKGVAVTAQDDSRQDGANCWRRPPLRSRRAT